MKKAWCTKEKRSVYALCLKDDSKTSIANPGKYLFFRQKALYNTAIRGKSNIFKFKQEEFK